MSDNHEQDPGDASKKLGRLRAQDALLWGNKVAAIDVTPAMVRHTEEPGARCICDVCDSTRVQPTLPVSLSNRTFTNRSKYHRLRPGNVAPSAPEANPPEPRKPVRANKPWQAPSLNERQIAFLMRLTK